MFYSAISPTLLSQDQIHEVMSRALKAAALDNKRVLVIVPDGTRSGPIGLLFQLLCKELLGRVDKLDVLIALGTHQAMDKARIRARLELTQDAWDALDGRVRFFNHEWWQAETFYTAGVLGADQVKEMTNGLLRQPVNIHLNRRVLEYDRLLICGPVFPHEVMGFSGGSKYLFPGIAGSEIINFTHWLGALLTSYAIIGTRDTPVRRIIEQAAQCVTTPRVDFCLVVREAGLAGLYIGDTREAWEHAVEHSAREHILYLDRPVQRVLSIMPPLYDDLWTAAKGMYKVEPVVADAGEVVIYAPALSEISYTHGEPIRQVGYHVRDYFVKQWDRFKHYPWGVLAHSTHLRGVGGYDAERQIEMPRIRVTLATGIEPELCKRINLDYRHPDSIRLDEWQMADTLIVPKAGERLYRLKDRSGYTVMPDQLRVI